MNKINVNLAKNITDIIVEFDFETAVKIFKLLDIKWTRDGEDRYPTTEDVKRFVCDLLWNLIERAYKNNANFYFSESGCFRGEYHKDDVDEWVDLIFEPCTWRKFD